MARGPAVLEAIAVAVGSAAVGALVLYPIGWAPVGAAVAGVNGALCGWRGSYNWRTGPGWAAAALDASWNLIGTTAGLGVHALSYAKRDPGYLDDLSRRQGRHVYARGFSPRKKFAFTFGNVISNAADVSDPDRRSLIEVHEGLHVWQQRWFGPFYPIGYGLWMLGGCISATAAWLPKRRAPWFNYAERHAYYYNPFERWAYSADHRWPPGRLVRLTAAARSNVDVEREPAEPA